MKLGKKWIFCSTFFFAGLACFFVALREGKTEMQWLKITMIMIGNSIFFKYTISLVKLKQHDLLYPPSKER